MVILCACNKYHYPLSLPNYPQHQDKSSITICCHYSTRFRCMVKLLNSIASICVHISRFCQIIGGLRVSFIHVCIVVGQGNPTEDQNNSSETRLCRVSDEIIQARGWDSLVPQQYIMMDTFSRPICVVLRFYMNSVSSA